MRTKRQKKTNRMSSSPLLPDTVLSIYCLQGVVPDQKCQSMDCFLGNWQEDDYSFLFFQKPVDKFIDALVSDDKNLQLVDQYAMTYEQWQGGPKESFQLGCFMVSPPGVQCPPESDRLSFTLDAGVVFGNGTHPTTRDCLLAIETACDTGNIETMLDLGTGTGVLALGAARLGVRKIAAVDYTLLAARTAQRNVQLNSLTDIIVVVNGRAEDFTCRPTDLMVANIHYDVMTSIVESEGFLRQKLFVLSGLLNSEAGKIVGILHDRGANIIKRWEAEETWQTILGSNG